MVLKTHLEPFREPLKVQPVGQQKNLFSKSVETLMLKTIIMSMFEYGSNNFGEDVNGDNNDDA